MMTSSSLCVAKTKIFEAGLGSLGGARSGKEHYHLYLIFEEKKNHAIKS